ncbi:MAG: AraC family transcriptional regulator ligand-binding domain-containing protein [Anaerolineae bacterium]|nr:AraC family transcriptional regulator ligand-binding domain-containing protein [Anaerolineae bacterium]
MRGHRASASIDLVHILMRYASCVGIAPAFVVTAIGPALNDPSARISIEKLSLVWRAVAQRSGDPNFGLHLGEAAGALSAGSILFTVMLNCATVESALEKLARYHALATDFVQLRLRRQGDALSIPGRRWMRKCPQTGITPRP